MKNKKCIKGKKWDEENDDQLPLKERVCHNCVWQFMCKKSDYQFVDEK